jgi:hypothetical protein
MKILIAPFRDCASYGRRTRRRRRTAKALFEPIEIRYHRTLQSIGRQATRQERFGHNEKVFRQIECGCEYEMSPIGTVPICNKCNPAAQ